MRFAVFGFIALCLLALVIASPASDNKSKTSTINACSRDCGDKYEPVCGRAKKSGRERLITFGSDCVMANYNCAHAEDPFELKAKGECGGNVSVRLS